MSTAKFGVIYTIDGRGEFLAGPYLTREVAESHRADIDGYVGILAPRVVSGVDYLAAVQRLAMAPWEVKGRGTISWCAARTAEEAITLAREGLVKIGDELVVTSVVLLSQEEATARVLVDPTTGERAKLPTVWHMFEDARSGLPRLLTHDTSRL